MPTTVLLNPRHWTYGCEHELADWDTRKGWDGFDRDPEPNIVNSNGIAADPSLKLYPFGAEINTPPTNSVEAQGDLLRKFLKQHPKATVNWRCGLHVHVRIPGLSESLTHLKILAKYINANTEVYDLVDPLPRENVEQHQGHMKNARRRYNWMRMSHFTKIPDNRVAQQLKAKSLKEFFELEVPRSKVGKPLWHAQPRAAINLRQLKQTDTIEFRHFPATLSGQETVTAVMWCRDYLLSAFEGFSAVKLFENYRNCKFPILDTIYNHRQELRWLRTTRSKGNTQEMVVKAIAEILKEDSDEDM